MPHVDALRALDIYRRAGRQVILWELFLATVYTYRIREILEKQTSLGKVVLSSSAYIEVLPYFQAERLSEFYEICKGLDIRRGETFIKIEQVLDFSSGTLTTLESWGFTIISHINLMQLIIDW